MKTSETALRVRKQSIIGGDLKKSWIPVDRSEAIGLCDAYLRLREAALEVAEDMGWPHQERCPADESCKVCAFMEALEESDE
jgi:hypothetical protein